MKFTVLAVAVLEATSILSMYSNANSEVTNRHANSEIAAGKFCTGVESHGLS